MGDMMSLTIDVISDEVMKWFDDLSDHELKQFTDLKEKDLILLHSSLGKKIRNEFNLWSADWIPDIRNGFDHSNECPDAISFAVILEVWKRLNEKQE